MEAQITQNEWDRRMVLGLIAKEQSRLLRKRSTHPLQVEMIERDVRRLMDLTDRMSEVFDRLLKEDE